jgi:mono/diheme cytochrome c family protein
MKIRRIPVFAALLLAAVTRLPAAEAKIDFASQIKPILGSRCISCHQSGALFGELNLENRDKAFRKRTNGPVILPGRPDSSLLYLVLKLPPKELKAMPPNGHRIPDREVQFIYDWILQGAEWPTGAEGVIHPPAAKADTGS